MQMLGQQLGEITIYQKAKYLLETGAAIIVFRKKNSELRVMLCTRNMNTARLAGCEAHLNSKNTAKSEADGNLIVCDLIIGETRQIHISRVAYSVWFNSIGDANDIEKLVEAFNIIKEQWSTYDDLDTIHQAAFCRTFHFDLSVLTN